MTTITAEIEEFDRATATGKLRVAEGKTLEFLSSSFLSKKAVRYPRKGEMVEVVLQPDGKVLLVRSK